MGNKSGNGLFLLPFFTFILCIIILFSLTNYDMIRWIEKQR